MFSNRARRIAALCLSFLLIGCSRSAAPGVERIAVLRFENLTPDRSLDWMGRAASEIVADELSAGRDVYVLSSATLHRFDPMLGGARPPAAAGISAEIGKALLAGATRLIYGQISLVTGKLRISASEEDVTTRKILRVVSAAGSSSTDLLSAADRIARDLSPRVRPFSTRNVEALHEYSLALEAPPSEAGMHYERAVAADPNFGAAYVKWARMAIVQQSREGFDKILAQAKSRGNAIPEMERAQLAVDGVNLQADPKGSIDALSADARLNPNDPDILRALATVELGARRYTDAIRHYEDALRTLPSNAELLNQLGYAQMFAGDYPGAMKALGEYQRLRPNEPNPLDSLGDANFYFGNFGEAEKFYLQAHAKNPGDVNDLLKAAHARLMTGDIAGANQIFAQYRKGRTAQDELAAFRTAEWQYLTGQRAEAVQNLSQLATVAKIPAIVSAAAAQAAIWQLQLGNRPRAREYAARAAAVQPSPLSALTSMLCEEAASVQDLRAPIDRTFPGVQNAAARRLALGYALLFARNFTEAAPVWNEIAKEAAPSDQAPQVLYGWTLAATGRIREAAPFLRWNPLPQPNSAADFTCLVYPRIFYLRALLLEKEGHKADAQREYNVFLKLLGSADDIFGEKKRAQDALTHLSS
ncbi:MAG: tetratricopeptide repeat protein [Acidobacteriota bacterium]|nr:tetratricopeptide repeat protein [Acidobacteriota bacterium]